MTSQGADPAYLNSESFSKFLGSELVRWEKVVKASGATLD
jgi:tripartite-type tricarboxylate transporter receptor subunit TctC